MDKKRRQTKKRVKRNIRALSKEIPGIFESAKERREYCRMLYKNTKHKGGWLLR